MRPPRPRLTVSRLMVAVAIAALTLCAEMGRRRYPHCQAKAARSVLVEKTHLGMAGSHERISALYRKLAKDPRQSRRYNEESASLFARAAQGELAKARRAVDRAQAYRRAALMPWMAVPPDEPEPAGVNITARKEQAEK